MGMRYYKKWLEDEGRFQYEERDHAVSDNTMTEITKDEFTEESEKQWAEYLASLPEEEVSDKPSYDELLAMNAALETENAALLYQILTGEELSDA